MSPTRRVLCSIRAKKKRPRTRIRETDQYSRPAGDLVSESGFGFPGSVPVISEPNQGVVSQSAQLSAINGANDVVDPIPVNVYYQ